MANPASDPLVGNLLDSRFHITRRIGEGGMGMVYEAVQTLIGRTVAIKVLHDRHAEKPEVAARLLHEAKLASSIQHQHIVEIYDVGTTSDGRNYVVMELLDGESLSTLIQREGPLAEKQVIDIARQVASALGAAHAQGIIHRDVKPENIFLVQRDGETFVKVVDFGISKLVRVDDADTPRLTQTGMVLGTPLYMSPEQARGEEQLDGRVDIYALGVILYECLTREVPFRGSNYLGILSQVITDPPLPPRQVAPGLAISEGMERLVLKALAKSRDDRYQTMADLATDLERVRSGVTITALRAVSQPRVGSRWAWIALTMALFVGGGLLLNARLHSQPPPAIVLQPAAPASPAPPASVIVRVATQPPGAKILDGARNLGESPRSIELVRSQQPVHLTFHLDGYDEAAYDVTPLVEGQEIAIDLLPTKRANRTNRRRTSGAADKAPAADPYRKH